MTTALRVFVNSNAVDVSPGATAIDAVRAWKSEEADAVLAGRRVITDSRGLSVAPDALAAAGSIFRTAARRPARATANPGEGDEGGA